MEEKLGDPYSIVSEINDDANREIAQVTKTDDFVVSDKLISLMLTQLSENRHLFRVFADLLDPNGSEIYLKLASDYLRPDAAANFATVIEAARRRGETALGYRLRTSFHTPPGYGVVLNPDKAAPLTLSADDRVIVLARNDSSPAEQNAILNNGGRDAPSSAHERCGDGETMSDQRLLRLGAQTAEVEALYARVLEASDPRSEQERLTALADAAGRLEEAARRAARREGTPARRMAARPPGGRTRLERRIVRARRTTEWIITRTTANPR
ncbi:hypothetical protein [Actinomadura soli]|uniref:hypothetical protein n=1 Tax=Actinomadura soli TaxID=2508997 RepID=UPI001E4A9CBE|nr:hypothetical protein [Actinomadura soli]